MDNEFTNPLPIYNFPSAAPDYGQLQAPPLGLYDLESFDTNDIKDAGRHYRYGGQGIMDILTMGMEDTVTHHMASKLDMEGRMEVVMEDMAALSIVIQDMEVQVVMGTTDLVVID